MTLEYGYNGSIDIASADNRFPTLDSNGDAIFSSSGGFWPGELISSDGKYRYLKSGGSSGNVLANELSDNFTILVLAKRFKSVSYAQFCSKPNNLVAGFTFHSSANSVNAEGPYLRVDSPAQQTKTFPVEEAKKIYDNNFHWWGVSIAGVNAASGNGTTKHYHNGVLTNTNTVTAQPGGLYNTNYFSASTGSATSSLNCLLVYARVLSDEEIFNICSGRVRPTDIDDCVGYYKFNETHGSANGECTDYSGQGNHLTYSGAAWETFDPASTTLTNFRLGQPYVTPKELDQTQWYNRLPPPIPTPEAQGSAIGITGIPYNALMNLTGDLSYGGWVYPRRNRANSQSLGVIISGYISANGPLVAYLVNGGKHISVTLGDTSTSEINSFQLSKAVPYNKWVHIYAVLAGNQLSLYLNGVFIETKTNNSVHGNPGAGWGLFDTNQGASTGGRSIRLLSRAISATEVNELFLTDQITDRSNLVAEWMCNTPHSNVITDTSGNGLHGTATGSKVINSPYMLNRPKRLGKQVKTQNSKEFSVSNSSIRNLIVGSSVLTVSSWVKMNRQQLTTMPIFGLFTSAGNALFFLSNSPTGYISLVMRESESAGVIIITTTEKWQNYLNSWILLSGEVDYANDLCKLFINGKLFYQSAASFTNTFYSDAGNPKIIAKADTTQSCSVDSARIWNRALTEQEHFDLYRDITPRDSLVCEYLFDRRNLLTYTNSFESWTSTGRCVISGGNPDPFGGNRAYSLTEDSTVSATHGIYSNPVQVAVIGNRYTYSVFAKQKTGSRLLQLQIVDSSSAFGGSNQSVMFDISNGSIYSTGGGAEGRIKALENGWYRCSVITIPATAANNIASKQIYPANAGSQSYSGDGVSGFYFYGAQLELGSQATLYEEIPDAGAYCQDTSGNDLHATWAYGLTLSDYVQEL